MNFTLNQEKFYDRHPTLSPWPQILSKKGLRVLYKPREVFFKRILDWLNIEKGSHVLEIGSGQGIFLARLCNQYGCIAKGVDISAESVEFANKYYSGWNIGFVKASAAKLPFAVKSFDLVVSFDTMEHVEDQGKMLSEIARVTRPGGKFLIYALNSSDSFTLDWLWENLGFDIYKRAMHKRSLFVDPKKLTPELKSAGFKSVKTEYYGGIFTLGLDEIIMVSLLISKKAGLFKFDRLGETVLYVLDKISKMFYPLLNFLDGFWYKRGHSLGFAVTGIKE